MNDNKDDNKNTILAIVLSGMVLLAWQYFIGLPKFDARQQQQQQQAQQQQSQPPAGTQPQAAPPPGPQVPGQAAPLAQQSREAVIAASPRIAIETPRLN